MSYTCPFRGNGKKMRRIEVDLSPDERRELEHIVKHERDARVIKRAQALLWLNEG